MSLAALVRRSPLLPCRCSLEQFDRRRLPGCRPAARGVRAGASRRHPDSVATHHPNRPVEVIVQMRAGANPAVGDQLVAAAGGTTMRDLPIINGLGAPFGAAAHSV